MLNEDGEVVSGSADSSGTRTRRSLWRMFVSCERYRTVIAGATKSMPRSWHASRAWTRRFCVPTAPRLLTSCERKRLLQSGFRSNGDVRSQTEPGPCRCTTSPNADVWTDLFPRSARLGGQTEDLGTGACTPSRHYDPFDALDIGTFRPEFGGRRGGNAVQRSVF